ncbi:uncharacterized protein BCR38DRAFT_490207 [Pseudomassariella vexata]|uniref:DUF7770 domain-containing protein n=1 Tax=Pseudomassariella vexata TaxID=1141098 RepID=A0A1Y2DDP0_9PEZI|nr:uncharacterized protein BCR38DRAFT_490207 [Pseudomassariella vexata]ORY57236.1 hypothetical protein BCR38DRAFT_490207 [Pseudomassariella vexata]
MSSQSPDVNLYPVTAIRVVIHTTGKFFEGDTRSGNHASIYLLVTGGSVHINMKKAQAHHTHGTLEVKTHSYQVSRTYVSRRRGFNLSRSGKGCRYWVYTILNDLNAAGYISAQSDPSVASVQSWLQFNYSRNQDPEPEPMEEGTFF